MKILKNEIEIGLLNEIDMGFKMKFWALKWEKSTGIWKFNMSLDFKMNFFWALKWKRTSKFWKLNMNLGFKWNFGLENEILGFIIEKDLWNFEKFMCR